MPRWLLSDIEPFPLPTRSLSAAAGLDRLLSTEWLLTNGLGGFAMGTAAGVPARRYHGLLVAATRPPGGRIMALNALVETLDIDPGTPHARSIDLSTFHFGSRGETLHPRGDAFLKSFESDVSVRWTWEIPVGGPRVTVTKEVYLYERTNAVAVRYALTFSGNRPPNLRLRIRPLVSLRDFHALIRRAWADRFVAEPGPAPGACRVRSDDTTLHLGADAPFTHDPQWWHDFHYAFDAARGQDCLEDLFSPGSYSVVVRFSEPDAAEPSKALTITAALDDRPVPDMDADKAARHSRLSALFADTTRATRVPEADRPTIASLIAATDQFVVPGAPPFPSTPPLPGGFKTPHASVIAGYPWFSDWGRDTFISLPGLMLATGRFDEARRTLLAFAARRRNGIIPNVFNDRTGEPEYNTADASLWFIHSACRYLEASGDRNGFDADLLPACIDIVSSYRRGTDFNIAMDPLDKLITAGAPGTQLTWMDARRDGVVFTPRYGKPVEINALWFNALRSLAEALAPKDPTAAAHLYDLAEATGASFRRSFWNAGAACLYDCLAPADEGGRAVWRPIADIRPNQIFAVSLPHSPLTDDQKRSVLACVRSRLYTPMGLRTLDPADPRYQPRYQGNLFERDRAYHNGTAWPWLLAPFAEATLRVGAFSDQARREARAVLDPILQELNAPRAGPGTPGCLGQIAEIYDGSDPQRPQGCTAQAWSVAEVLRVLLMTLSEPRR